MADAEAAEVRYTTSRGSLAWSAAGSGLDLVFVPNRATNRDGLWSTPATRSFAERLSARHPSVMYDRRGTGLSDREEAGGDGSLVRTERYRAPNGARIPFDDHGVHQLKGIDEPVHLYTVAG